MNEHILPMLCLSNQFYLKTGFYSREYKRGKSYPVEKNFHHVSPVSNLHANSKERVKWPSSNVIDYADPYALPKHLECLDDAEYGSVTKEYEAVHAQWIQLRNLLTSAYPTISTHQISISQKMVNLMSSNQQNSQPLSQGVIDLDIDCSASNADVSSLEAMREFGGGNTAYLPGSSSSPTYGKMTDGMDSISVIVLDSDEEDGRDRIGNRHASNSEPDPVHLQSQTQSLTSLKKQMRQGCDVPGNALTCGNIAVEANWQFPSPYQKVILSSVDVNSVNDLVVRYYCIYSSVVEFLSMHTKQPSL